MVDKPKVETIAVNLVPQIKTAFDASLKGGQDALKHAQEVGRHLADAKEQVLNAKLSWTKWREHHFPKLAQTTASLYMRVWTGRAHLPSNAVATLGSEGRLSVREAGKLVSQALLTPEEIAEREARKAKAKAAREAEKAKAKKTLKERLQDLKSANEVVALLRQAFDHDFLASVVEMLAKEDSLEFPAAPRRTPEQQQFQRRA
jgi:hypothetical protein